MNNVNNNPSNSSRATYYWLGFGALLCLLSVAVGAFAAHSLKSVINEYSIEIVETAARYQMYHGLAILLVNLVTLSMNSNTMLINKVNGCFSLGIILFSGSLYFLGITQSKMFVYLTPVGGLLLIVGWLIFAYAMIKHAGTLKGQSR